MSISLLRVGGVDLAFGLHWQPLQNPEQIDPMFEARQFGAEKNARYAVIVGAKAAGPMLGLWVDGRKPRGALSAAALLAGIGDGRRLAVAALPDGNFWLSLSASTGVLDPDLGDVVGPAKLIANRLDNAATRISAAGARDFRPTVVGDVQLDSPWVRNAQPIAWATLIEHAAAAQAARIHSLSGGIPRWMLAAALVGFSIAAYAGLSYYRAAEARRAEAETRQIPAEALQLRAARIAETVQAALAQDSASPTPTAVARACFAAADRLGWRYHGWVVTQITCDPVTDTIKASLRADFTAFDAPLPATLKDAVDHYGGRVEFAADLQNATLSHSIDPQQDRAGLTRDALPRFDQFALTLGTAIAALRVDQDRFAATTHAAQPKALRFLDPTQRDPTTGADIEVDAPLADSYMTVAIDLSSERIDPVLDAIADYQQTLRLDRIEFTPSPDRTVARFFMTQLLHP